MADSFVKPALTGRESEVLELVARGRNNKEVARSLGISLSTVKAHMRGLLAKLDARCRTEALWIASQRGLIVRSAEAFPERIWEPVGARSGAAVTVSGQTGHAQAAAA